MATNESYQRVMQLLSERRNRAKAQASARYEELSRHLPRLQELERELSGTGMELVRAVMAGAGKSSTAVSAVRERNLKLQRERAALLFEAGVGEDFLNPPYVCPVCQDEGYVHGKRCACLEKLLREDKLKRLNAASSLALCSFETFRLDYYSGASDANGMAPRKRMEEVLSVCRQYAKQFFPGCGKNLLMLGATGLGKTHLSLSIAAEVIGAGYETVYGSVQDLFRQVETERFSKDGEPGALDALLSCDLLILDDLGSEFVTSFTSATLYNLINTRMNRSAATIISTNLPLKELNTLYADRVVSRLIGGYTVLQFLGTDIRASRRVNGTSSF